MGDVIDRLLARTDINTHLPATAADIAAISRRVDAQIPALLEKLWRASDGVELDRLNAHLLGPSEICRLLENAAPSDDVGILPILDDHESNYLAIVVRPPVAYRVVYLPHDDGSSLMYRSFESFVTDLLQALDEGTAAEYYSPNCGDYSPDAPRTEEDQRAAKELMQTNGEREEWNWAAQLLDASNLEGWAALLETDHFVRRDVRGRMQGMTSPAIHDLLARDAAAFEEFVARAADAARGAGLEVGRRDGEALQIGGKWIGLESFFHRRSIPNATPRMIAWIEDLIAGRNPYDRPGNFDSD